jgi:3-phosphoshikimate 1-carboxyvinyltransferase
MKDIKPLQGIDATVSVPGSKSYTQRAMIIAALAEGSSCVRNTLIAEDTGYVIEALRSLGADIQTEGGDMTIKGTGGHIKNPGKDIYLGNNGTAMRLLTGVVALGRGPFTLTGSPRLCQRPIKPLLDALTSLGVDAQSKGNNGYPPVFVSANGLRGGTVTFADIESSQYISAILICAPFAERDTVIELQGTVPSLPYVDMTVDAMGAFGVEVITERPVRYTVKSGQQYQGKSYSIEGDCSSASYFFLAAALCKGKVKVQHINPRTLQGDINFLTILKRLGCTIIKGKDWIEVVGDQLTPGEFTFDLGNMPDMVPTLAVLSAVRPGRTIIKNVPHLRAKESDRLAALAAELRKVGMKAEETDDGLVIEGNKAHGAEIETYNDHRIAMSFAVLGLVIPGIRIQNAGCVDKSFPGFWDELEKLYR